MALDFEPERILIVLHGSVGDVTRALPLATLIRRRYPGAFLAWSVEPACLPLLEYFDAIDEVIVFDRSRPLSSLWPFLRKIRAHRFDLVLDLQRHLKSGLISGWSGARCRLGFDRADGKEFNWIFNNRHIAACGEAISKFDHYLKFVEYLGIAPTALDWTISLTPQDKIAVRRHLANVAGEFAALFVGSRWESKDWFPEQVTACANELYSRYHWPVVLLGARQQNDIAEQVAQSATGTVVNLVGRTSLREAAGIVSRAVISVGPDTGLMHVAAAMGNPVISLWGATDPQRTGPYGFADLVIKGQADCSPCYRKTCSIGKICMLSIGSEVIMNKVELVLSRRSAPQIVSAKIA